MANTDLMAIRRIGLYLLKVVQEYMIHQGPRFYNDAKAVRTRLAGAVASEEVQKLRAGLRKAEADAAALQAACTALQKPTGAGTQIDLFAALIPEPMAERPFSGKTSQTGARDSDLS